MGEGRTGPEQSLGLDKAWILGRLGLLLIEGGLLPRIRWGWWRLGCVEVELLSRAIVHHLKVVRLRQSRNDHRRLSGTLMSATDPCTGAHMATQEVLVATLPPYWLLRHSDSARPPSRTLTPTRRDSSHPTWVERIPNIRKHPHSGCPHPKNPTWVEQKVLHKRNNRWPILLVWISSFPRPASHGTQRLIPIAHMHAHDVIFKCYKYILPFKCHNFVQKELRILQVSSQNMLFCYFDHLWSDDAHNHTQTYSISTYRLGMGRVKSGRFFGERICGVPYCLKHNIGNACFLSALTKTKIMFGTPC